MSKEFRNLIFVAIGTILFLILIAPKNNDTKCCAVHVLTHYAGYNNVCGVWGATCEHGVVRTYYDFSNCAKWGDKVVIE